MHICCRHFSGTVVAMVACVVVASACNRIGSRDVSIEDMSASYAIFAFDEGTLVTAQLNRWVIDGEESYEGTAETVELNAGERLLARSGDLSTELAATTNPGALLPFIDPLHYEGELEVLEPATVVEVAFERGDETLLASVAIPDAPIVAAPAAGAEFSRGDGLTIEIEGAAVDDFFLVTFDGPCVTGWGYGTEQGRVVVDFDGNQSDATCDVTVSVSREVTGTVEPGFAEADITATRTAAPFTLRSAP